MWHLRTKTGTFWIVPAEDEDHYLLGVGDDTLGEYNDLTQAAKDVHDQETGCTLWDNQKRVKAPDSVDGWSEGEPEEWAS